MASLWWIVPHIAILRLCWARFDELDAEAAEAVETVPTEEDRLDVSDGVVIQTIYTRAEDWQSSWWEDLDVGQDQPDMVPPGWQKERPQPTALMSVWKSTRKVEIKGRRFRHSHQVGHSRRGGARNRRGGRLPSAGKAPTPTMTWRPYPTPNPCASGSSRRGRSTPLSGTRSRRSRFPSAGTPTNPSASKTGRDPDAGSRGGTPGREGGQPCRDAGVVRLPGQDRRRRYSVPGAASCARSKASTRTIPSLATRAS